MSHIFRQEMGGVCFVVNMIMYVYVLKRNYKYFIVYKIIEFPVAMLKCNNELSHMA